MHDFKDISGVSVIAGRKTPEERQIEQSKARLGMETSENARRFTDPVANVRAMGIDPGMKVADFGAGSGAYALATARAVGHSGRAYAVDVQKDLLVRIKNNASQEGMDWVEIIWGDFEVYGGTRIADKSVDVVIMSNVLFQLDHAPSAFIEAKRIVKLSGRLIIIDWTDSFNGMGPEPKRVVTKEKALELAAAASFEFVREFSAGEHHYGLILRPIFEKQAPAI